MTSHLAFIRSYVLQTSRDWPVIVLSLAVPGAFCAVLTNVGFPMFWALSIALPFAIMANGLFGAAVRIAHERQLGVLRRLRAAPVSASHIVIGAVLGGIIVYAPCLVALIAVFVIGSSGQLAHPQVLLGLTIAGLLCCRAIGVFVAAVSGSVQQTQLVAQLLTIFLMFTSAMAWSPSEVTQWMQFARDVSPTYHLTAAFLSLLAGQAKSTDVMRAISVLSLTGIVFMIAASYLFRWDTEEDRMPLLAQVSMWVVFGILLLWINGLRL